MSKNLQSPTKLTEFAPLQQEEKPQSVGQFISNFFKRSRANDQPDSDNGSSAQEAVPTWAEETVQCLDSPVPNMYLVDLNEGRNLPNVLKRISNLLALKTNNLQDYADTELKQYWMPDSVSKECYECSERFTTFRRRHHCRVCGQIFCSQCCYQQIPGKIFGCTGDLRVCTYCCKVVLSYLQSSNFGANLSADLKALQENLQSKFGDSPSGLLSNELSPNSGLSVSEGTESLRRKISVGYQEETFVSDSSSITYLTNEERCKALQNSASLRNLYDDICKPVTGINFSIFKYRLRTYPDCFLGSELVDWLICQQKAKTRVQAAALAQALLEGTYIESFSESGGFVDGYVRYRKGNLFAGGSYAQLRSSAFELSAQEEPSWVQQTPHESSNTDSDNEQMSPPLQGLSTSNSYKLNLNLKASSVYLSRPPESPIQNEDNEPSKQFNHEETNVVRPSEKRELAPESGWFNASALREENGEKEAYELLTEAYEQHELNLLKQLLSAKGLSLSWIDLLIPLTRDIASVIRPDKNHDATELDIRYYAKVKKLPGGSRSDTSVINGIVFSKNVAHKEMAVDIESPRILLLECSIVYQRTEGRLMSLEPVLMQEQEYLRQLVTRISALRPDIVLVQKNISRLAQDMLRKHKITLVHNVKRSILERLARCTEADIVASVDAHIGIPKLGTCKRFYLKSFNIDKDTNKTLMFFEGLVAPYLGGTVLLRGNSKAELQRVKKVTSFLIFAAYNWRLEKSFLMDEFALPPNSRMEFLDESREASPQSAKSKILTTLDSKLCENTKYSEQQKGDFDRKSTPKFTEQFSDPLQLMETKKIVSLSVNDNSDPLQSSDEVMQNRQTETLTVEKLPFSNNFKKHLDDTILCISPYIIFPTPYLETDTGRRCKLRRFFFNNMYYSDQFEPSIKNKWKTVEIDVEEKYNRKNLRVLHPFLNAKITNIDDNNVQNMLAHFRACGGQYPKKEVLNVGANETQEESSTEKGLLDVLDPMNHQRLAVLFHSFSHESNNAPAFCVNPWVVYMDFYGKNDIPLGCFLERYCFRPSYSCPSKTCATPMVKHVRRFVHSSGSVTVSLNKFENEHTEEDIVMWSWCTKCTSVSPVVPLSADSWSYSFAKYLELRFHGEVFNRRGQTPCNHSLHHDHFHYFGYKNYVASFKYSPIRIWEISLPPLSIEIVYDVRTEHEALIEEGKSLALKGHDLFSIILDKVSIIPSEELEGVGNVRQILTKEQALFKQKVEEVQLKLTSPSVENKEFCEANIVQAYWKIKDNVVRIKMSLSELVDTWNAHLIEAIRKSDKNKKDKSSLPELESPVSEVTEKGIIDSQRDTVDVEKGDSLDESSGKSQSDGPVAMLHIEELTDSKKEIKKEKSVKHILDKLLPSSGQLNPIQSPFASEEHYNLPAGVYGPLPVFETELSSIIAYALNSHEYKDSLAKKTQNLDQTPSPLTRRKNNAERIEDEKSGLLGFLRTKDSKTDLTYPAISVSGSDSSETEQAATPDKLEDQKRIKNSHVEIQFQDNTCNFFCRIYLADKFAQLRFSVIPGGEESYIRSLSRSVQWNAVGGKSGSSFAKTLDDRFILKEMPRAEVHMFLESSSNYFTYMQKCFHTRQPTLLGKIVGMYQTIYKNSTNAPHHCYLLVMDNLFYKRDVSQKFDLKGSVRNRFVVPDNREGEIVWHDENLLKMTCDNPLYVLPHSKEVLLAAIHNDTEFLSTQSVMDYSLLVGLDSTNRELVLGIIDYIRTFTWDKKLETMVKRTGILGGQGKLPTIISPEEYQKRFIEAMHRYFLEVPDHYAGMGKGLDV
ncbi:1-phosphatidylinositol 3-phosphate 5-kinase isoform X1 [Euwallacea similis]|uniref:1-phosphatidylinositol 3-phosphate 5-kinase isoform X1 n=1 Tax=Euwallacea similis TaxID=1736056 RepID=UPI00344B8A18